MAAPELGTKRQCPSCSARFYDLGRLPPLRCVKCSHVFEPDLFAKSRKPRLIINDDEPETREEEAVDAFSADFTGVDEDVFEDGETVVRRGVREDVVLDDDADGDDDALPDDHIDEDAEPASPSAQGGKKNRR